MPSISLVVLHGYPFDHTMWDHVVALLGDDFPVLAPDLPGFGGRPVAEHEPSMTALADDVARLLDRQGIGRAVMAGMSMGGYVALAFAEHHKEQLAGLGLISTQADADSDQTRANRRDMIQKVQAGGADVAARGVLEKVF